ncbi:MAG: hypothetical protein J0I07_11800 [Myxococcales bacterium]|nr:hypothetical protein [Myxococcales bacterium]
MIRCERCGASLDPMVAACPYCQLTTPAGVAAQQRESQVAEQARVHAQWASAAQQQAHAVEQRRIQGIATQSLLWSIAGIVLCCLPLGVIGIVQGLRARSASVARSLPVPGLAKVGLWLGIASCLTSVVLVTWGGLSAAEDEERANARAAELEKAVGTRAELETLDRTAACQLAEAHTLRNGWNDKRGYSLERFECPGKLEQAADRAELQDFRVYERSGNDKEHRVFVCFKRGGRWFVDSLSKTPCGVAPAGETAAPSTTTGATPNSASPPARRR